MTLDDFLRTLETLIDDRESNDDPGEGNFGCEDCRRCNHCRFCVGCDSCEDCTYCEESIDCMSCTQSKRCVGCEKVSYCEDCRDCKISRYLTLCVDCTNCVHCLGCVGLAGAEFYVLNEKRTRKEYFALLRQIQELMQPRMEVGWRPPGIGLASEIDDPLVAGRDVELTAAPWLEDAPEPEPEPHRHVREPWRDELAGRDERVREFEFGRERPGRNLTSLDGRRREPEPEREREPAWIHERAGARRDVYADDDLEPESLRGIDEARRSGRVEVDELGDRRPRTDRAPAPRYPDELDYEDPRRGRAREPAPERESWQREREPWTRGDRELPRDHRELGDDREEPDYDDDAPRTHEQQPTQPFHGARGRAREHDEPDPRRAGEWDDRPAARVTGWDDSRERTVAREERVGDRGGDHGRVRDDDPLLDDDAPGEHDREPSSPWIDEEAQAQAQRRANLGSLRRAGRPKRKPDAEPPREVTGSGSYRTGNAPTRTGSEGTHTGTGLRLGRKPKRR